MKKTTGLFGIHSHIFYEELFVLLKLCGFSGISMYLYVPGILAIVNFNENGHPNQLGSLEACLGSLELGIEKCIPTPYLVVKWMCCSSCSLP